MSKGNEVPNLVNYIVGNDTLQQLLPHMFEQLELCQKALSGYLDQKRAAFPRFFFVADATLLEVLSQGSNPQAIQPLEVLSQGSNPQAIQPLEVLSQGSNPQAIQPHLQSCFDSVVYAEFNKKDKAKVEALFSGEGQSIKLTQIVNAEGNIEDWLGKLLREMQVTVSRIICYAAADSEHMSTRTSAASSPRASRPRSSTGSTRGRARRSSR